MSVRRDEHTGAPTCGLSYCQWSKSHSTHYLWRYLRKTRFIRKKNYQNFTKTSSRYKIIQTAKFEKNVLSSLFAIAVMQHFIGFYYFILKFTLKEILEFLQNLLSASLPPREKIPIHFQKIYIHVGANKISLD